jgi:hypothetical protein
MDYCPLIAIAVITNGDSAHFARTSRLWFAEGFVPGRTLFFCGPRSRLVAQGIDDVSIIDYLDPPYYRNNFHINHKKRFACQAIDAKYIYLVHDRFFPQKGLLSTLSLALAVEDIDFGAVDVDNPDGTPALRELRLKRAAVSVPLESALVPLGRLVCDSADPAASDNIAINGGQFFLRKTLAVHLNRAMRWVEMEDDVLSHDLRTANGRWITGCRLTTGVYRLESSYGYAWGTKLKYFLYRITCNALAALTNSISVGQRLDRQQLEGHLADQVLLVDPLHKTTSSDFLPSSLEKLMARARIASNGKCWTKVVKHRLGWKLIGLKGEK